MKGSTQPMIKIFEHKDKCQNICIFSVFIITVLVLCFNILCESFTKMPIDYIRDTISLFLLLGVECCVMLKIR